MEIPGASGPSRRNDPQLLKEILPQKLRQRATEEDRTSTSDLHVHTHTCAHAPEHAQRRTGYYFQRYLYAVKSLQFPFLTQEGEWQRGQLDWPIQGHTACDVRYRRTELGSHIPELFLKG